MNIVKMKKEHPEVAKEAFATAFAFIINDKFDQNEFNQNYNKGLTEKNDYFAYEFGKECANMITMRPEQGIREKTPVLLKVLSQLNDEEFDFALNCFKNRMIYHNPSFSDNLDAFNVLIRESVKNTELEHNPIIQTIMKDGKEKVINNIANMKEDSVVTNGNKLKNN